MTSTVVAPILERLGYKLERAKTNTGLGRESQPLSSRAPHGNGELDDEHTAPVRRLPQSFHDDYVVFAMASKGTFKQADRSRELRRFLQIALEFKPVNLGDARHGGAFASVASQ